MVNFLALLGWSPGGDRELLISATSSMSLFTLEGISGGNAVFNPEKLDWFNQQHIARLPAAELLRRIEDRLRERRPVARQSLDRRSRVDRERARTTEAAGQEARSTRRRAACRSWWTCQGSIRRRRRNICLTRWCERGSVSSQTGTRLLLRSISQRRRWSFVQWPAKWV